MSLKQNLVPTRHIIGFLKEVFVIMQLMYFALLILTLNLLALMLAVSSIKVLFGMTIFLISMS